ncbi:MAG: type II toxin-antitoxin system VapC family toxin [Candidatus Solibacter usitatus]|nr:type II toxin-antitoxin system VapC family toxin [Candidatus Solibacter usitatus]
MKAYLDSSVILRRVLDQPEALGNWDQWDLAIASELARVETSRAMDRLRLSGRMTDDDLAEMRDLLRSLMNRLYLAPIAPEVLERAAAPLPVVVGSLDAIHLATALLWMDDHRETLLFVTHDARLAVAARLCGLEVSGAGLRPA